MISSSTLTNQQVDGFSKRSNRPKIYATRKFPEGCGAYVSRMKLEENRKENFPYTILSNTLSNQQVDGFSRKAEHPKVYAISTFCEGCGPLKSRMNSKENNKEISTKNMISSNVPSNQQVDHGCSRKPKRSEVHAIRTFPEGCKAQMSVNLTENNKENSTAAMAIDHLEARKRPSLSIISSNTSFANKSQLSNTMENALIKENPPSEILKELPPLAYNKPHLNVKDSSRDKVKNALYLFQEMLSKLLQQNDQGYHSRSKVYMKAAKLLKKELKWINTSQRLGDIPGVQVGDKFECMAELNVIGLHHQFLNGIDYMKKNGKNLATSIVASGRYNNIFQSSDDTLIYSGHGGNPSVRKNISPKDQKLERGNLALKNSIEAKTPVRVIRGLKFSKSSKLTITSCKSNVYVYDGLYYVHDYWQERGQLGKLVFKFSLKRISSQPKLHCTKTREEINYLKQE